MNEARELVIAQEILNEFQDAEKMFSPFHNAHEALGVIREEYIEFEQEVFKVKDSRVLTVKMRNELIQLAAMALRAVNDIPTRMTKECMYRPFETGTKVRYIGDVIKEQIRWGNHTDPRDMLVIGGTYTIDRIEVHSWHTEVFLCGLPKSSFNSVWFEEIKEDDDKE